MKTVRKENADLKKKLYEGLFLVDSAQAAADWDGINKVIETILKKAGADIVSIRKWDDRKLVYGINGKTRGTYILCYFRADGVKIQQIERDVQLSETIMRVLILCAEHWTEEDIEKDTPATSAEKQRQKAAQQQAIKTEEAKETKEAEETKEAAEIKQTEKIEAEETEEAKQSTPEKAKIELPQTKEDFESP